MNDINLSWVITTKDKLCFLQPVLEHLFQFVEPDEEVIVIDGASTDGTKEYLQELYNAGKIHQFVSEPDMGEAHGFNKGILMAKGTLIKLLSDDDAFFYPGIKCCKKFMLENPQIDILASEGAGYIITCEPSSFYMNYKEYLNCTKPFAFCGLGLMFRKSSIPLIGLFNTNIICVDNEFAYRITSGKANLAWYTGYNWARILNNLSNTNVYSDQVQKEREKVKQFYEGATLKDRFERQVSRIQKNIIKPARYIKKKILGEQKNNITVLTYDIISKKFNECYNWLEEINKNNEFEFLTKK